MTRYTIVRHGETEAFKTGILQTEDEPLNSAGIEQARKVAMRLKGEVFDKIFCSDAVRAQQTLNEFQVYFPRVPVKIVPDLRERSWGIFQGLHFSESKKAADAAGVHRDFYRPEKGENMHDVAVRAKRAWNFVRDESRQCNHVLVVTHGVLLSFLIAAAQGKQTDFDHVFKIREKQIVPTSVSVLDVLSDRTELVCVGDTCHLESAGKKILE